MLPFNRAAIDESVVYSPGVLLSLFWTSGRAPILNKYSTSLKLFRFEALN